jgi:hypothetical protein
LATHQLSTKKRLREAFLRVLNSLIELIAHLAVLSGLLAGIWTLEKLVYRLWGSSDYVFFGSLRLRYVFDGADLAILVGFLIWGVHSVIAAYVRKPE